MFSFAFCEISKNTFLHDTCGRLLLCTRTVQLWKFAKMPVSQKCVYYHKIPPVKAFYLKLKATLSWNTTVLEFFTVEFNCIGNHFLNSFSKKFLRNHFLVLVSTFCKWLFFRYFVIILNLSRYNISNLYLRKYKVSKAAFLENNSRKPPLYNLIQSFALTKILLYVRDVSKTQSKSFLRK